MLIPLIFSKFHPFHRCSMTRNDHLNQCHKLDTENKGLRKEFTGENGGADRI